MIKDNVVFLRSSRCNDVFSPGQARGHRHHDSPLPKTLNWVKNCTKFGQLIFGKIIKIVATSCESLRLKCTKFDFGWGSGKEMSEREGVPSPFAAAPPVGCGWRRCWPLCGLGGGRQGKGVPLPKEWSGSATETRYKVRSRVKYWVCNYLPKRVNAGDVVGIGFQSTYPCHTHGNTCGNSHESPYQWEFPYLRQSW